MRGNEHKYSDMKSFFRFLWRKIDSYGWIFAVTALLSLLFTAASVIWQVSRAARTDPAEALKTE